MDYILRVLLEQQTPIIHFQYGQTGATLRASEVKPKLDRFLIRMLGGEEKARGEHPDWFLKGKYPALAYKLRFRGIGTPSVTTMHEKDVAKTINANRQTKPTDKISGFYYGNMVKEKDLQKKAALIRKKYKEAVSWNDGVDMTVICFAPGLLDFLKGNLAAFFFRTNFGACQSKGYGSFTLKEETDEETDHEEKICQALCEEYGAGACYYYTVPGRRVDTLESVKTVYGMMKSGLNLGYGKYRRSLLFCYMHEVFGIGNEKAWMKQNGIAPSDVGPNAGLWDPETLPAAPETDSEAEHPPYYVRALLGVGDAQSWQVNKTDPNGNLIDACRNGNPRRVKNRSGTDIVAKETKRTKITVSSDEIERFPSPVFFKIVGKTVYFVGGRIDKRILGEPDGGVSFTFSGEYKVKVGNLATPEFGTKATDGSGAKIDEDFMDGFLAYCFDRWDSPPDGGQTKLSEFLNGGRRDGNGRGGSYAPEITVKKYERK